jgi:hypothetical protein
VTHHEMLPIRRFLQTMDVVRREGEHLAYSRRRVFGQPVDAQWVRELEAAPELAERLEAFVSRFGRMQDTIADKLLPRWLQALAESPGSQIENLNRAERLGVIESVERWLEARKLRNRLVHEYMENPNSFAEDLMLAHEYTDLLIDAFNRVRVFASTRMGLAEGDLPPVLPAKFIDP